MRLSLWITITIYYMFYQVISSTGKTFSYLKWSKKQHTSPHCVMWHSTKLCYCYHPEVDAFPVTDMFYFSYTTAMPMPMLINNPCNKHYFFYQAKKAKNLNQVFAKNKTKIKMQLEIMLARNWQSLLCIRKLKLTVKAQ